MGSKQIVLEVKKVNEASCKEDKQICCCMQEMNEENRRYVEIFRKIGAFLLCTSILLGSFYIHVVRSMEISDKLKHVFLTANTMHFYMSFSLLLVHNSKRPKLAGTIITLGFLCFSGSCYYYAMLNTENYTLITPLGGILMTIGCLMLGF